MRAYELADALDDCSPWIQTKEGWEAASLLRVQHDLIVKLSNALQWYIDNDDVYEGGKWEEENAYWIEGKRTALELITEVQQLDNNQEGESV